MYIFGALISGPQSQPLVIQTAPIQATALQAISQPQQQQQQQQQQSGQTIQLV
jgi:hypothetical protein